MTRIYCWVYIMDYFQRDCFQAQTDTRPGNATKDRDAREQMQQINATRYFLRVHFKKKKKCVSDLNLDK